MIGHIFTERLRLFTFFVLSYFIGFFIAAIMLGNKEFIFYEAAMAVIIIALVFMDKRVGFTRTALTGLALWGLMHLAGGLMPIPTHLADDATNQTPVLYNMRFVPWLPRYDQFVHAFGFGVAVIASHEALQAHFKHPLKVNFQIGTILFLISMGLGALNEVIEFIAVLCLPKTNVGGFYNTGWDMISNGTGAVIGILYLKLKRHK